MNILFVSSEVEPFAKTGGLADVCGALPRSIAQLGARISVITPFYRETSLRVHKPVTVAKMKISVGPDTFNTQIVTDPQQHDVPVYFVRCDKLFDRDGIYENAGRAFFDNHVRFICFSKAVLTFCRTTGMQPDILHLNDWQSALIAAFLQQPGHETLLRHCASVLTIHNLAYQGVFPPEVFKLTGLPSSFWNPEQLEFWGRINFLKAGIVNADLITTVSPTYAHEITGPECGCGLEGVLATREQDLFGILNGADYDAWDPAQDSLIKAGYDACDLSGKQACKHSLIQRFNLDPALMQRPLIGCISRLVDEKGFDLISDILEELLKADIGFVLLGTGEKRYHDFFTRMAKLHPKRVGVLLAYDNAAAHQIEAGCDLFAMPSRYEPCGLTQLHSLKYGTVPVVRKTGGLADTIIDCDQNPDRGNGFVFETYSGEALLNACMRALSCYRQPAQWQALIQRCMACNFSWDVSANAYLELYRKALDKKVGKTASQTN
jgi:starch synthase